jgi:hypothetical protein
MANLAANWPFGRNWPFRWYSTHRFANSTKWLFRSYSTNELANFNSVLQTPFSFLGISSQIMTADQSILEQARADYLAGKCKPIWAHLLCTIRQMPLSFTVFRGLLFNGAAGRQGSLYGGKLPLLDLVHSLLQKLTIYTELKLS